MRQFSIKYEPNPHENAWTQQNMSVFLVQDGQKFHAITFDESSMSIKSQETITSTLNGYPTKETLAPFLKIDKKYFAPNMSKMTLVPQELVANNLEENSEFLYLSHKKENNNSSVYEFNIPSINAQIFYEVDSGARLFKDLFFQEAKIIPPYLGWMTHILGNYLNTESIHLHIADDFIWILAFNDNKLKLFNQYPINTKEDILYFLLATIKLSEIKFNQAEYFYSTSINVSSVNLIIEYLQKEGTGGIKFHPQELPFVFSYPQGLEQTYPDTFSYYDLMTLPCVL